MSELYEHLTHYAEIDLLLNHLLWKVQYILRDQLTGLYVHGSLANGDFNPVSSDIDFVVVTEGSLTDEIISALRAMHEDLREGNPTWAQKLEGSYISKAALRFNAPDCTEFPALHVDGTFGLDTHGSDWVIQRHIIREKGIVVAGPPPAALIDPVEAEDLRMAVQRTLAE